MAAPLIEYAMAAFVVHRIMKQDNMAPPEERVDAAVFWLVHYYGMSLLEAIRFVDSYKVRVK